MNEMDEKEAHKKYNQILKNVKKIVGGKTTYLGQLDRAGKSIFGNLHALVYNDRTFNNYI